MVTITVFTPEEYLAQESKATPTGASLLACA